MWLQILMSTYNGEKYLHEQIDSIFTQTIMADPDWQVEIIVRDDGSTDQTVDILEDYSLRYKQFRYYTGYNKGVIASFFELICQTSEGVDYIALSDQDDVWMPDKLECAVAALSEEVQSQPLLYCGFSQLTDENLHPIEGVFKKNVHPAFGNALVENICTGCTAVFNAALRDLVSIQIPDFTPMHDWWLYLLASCFGKVHYDTLPHMYYRQHSSNTIGVSNSYLCEFINRVRRFKKNRYQIRRHIKSLNDICQAHHLNIEQEKLQQIKDILEVKAHFSARIRVVRNPQIYRQRKGDDLIFRLIILSGTL